MPNYDANSAEVNIFTFKDGLLSAVAHDLKIKVTKFTIAADGATAKGEFDATSLVVVNAMKDGAENPGALPASGPDEIKKTIKDEILNAAKNPTIKFDGKIAGADVVGNLTLNGATKEVKGSAKKEGGKNVVEFKFDQRDFGIKPYSAMLGTLKVKPEVTVRIAVPS